VRRSLRASIYTAGVADFSGFLGRTVLSPIAEEGAADETHRLADVLRDRGSQYAAKSSVPGADTLTSAAATLITEVPKIAALGPTGSALAAGGQSHSGGVTHGRDAGLSESDTQKFAVREGLIEAATTLVMNKLGTKIPGFGGLETKFGAPAVKETIGRTLARAGIGTVGELTEEQTIAILSAFNHALSGVDPNATDLYQLLPKLGETALVTLATMGLANAKPVVQAGVRTVTARNPAEQRQRAAELRTPEGAAKWAVDNPTLAKTIVEKAGKVDANGHSELTRGLLGRLTETLRDAWGKGTARDGFIGRLKEVLSEQAVASAQPSGRPQGPATTLAGDPRQTAPTVESVSGRQAVAEYKSESHVTPGRSRPDSASMPPTARFPQEGFATLSNGSRVALGKGVVSENGDIVVPGKGGKPGRTYSASAVARVETPDGQTAWRKPPNTPTTTPRAAVQSPANSSIRESPPNVRSDATVQLGHEAPRGPNAPRVPSATNTSPTPQAAHVPEGGYATLENGSRVAFGPGAVSENGDIVVPGTGGKPGQTIPASKIVRVESPGGRSVWRRPPRGGANNASSAGPSARDAPSDRDFHERRNVARARLAAAEAELRNLNVGRGEAKVASAASPGSMDTEKTHEAEFQAAPSLAPPSARAPSVAAALTERPADRIPARSRVAPSAVANVTGRPVGPRYRKIGRLERRLKGWGIDVYRDADDILDLKGAATNRHLGAEFTGRSDGTGRLLLRTDATRYEVLHELSHVLDFRINPRGWVHASRNKNLSNIMCEQAVFNRLRNGKKWWTFTFQEQLHAFRYIERIGGNGNIFMGSGRTISQFRFEHPSP